MIDSFHQVAARYTAVRRQDGEDVRAAESSLPMRLPVTSYVQPSILQTHLFQTRSDRIVLIKGNWFIQFD